MNLNSPQQNYKSSDIPIRMTTRLLDNFNPHFTTITSNDLFGVLTSERNTVLDASSGHQLRGCINLWEIPVALWATNGSDEIKDITATNTVREVDPPTMCRCSLEWTTGLFFV
jgi:hypothetical protein